MDDGGASGHRAGLCLAPDVGLGVDTGRILQVDVGIDHTGDEVVTPTVNCGVSRGQRSILCNCDHPTITDGQTTI